MILAWVRLGVVRFGLVGIILFGVAELNLVRKPLGVLLSSVAGSGKSKLVGFWHGLVWTHVWLNPFRLGKVRFGIIFVFENGGVSCV